MSLDMEPGKSTRSTLAEAMTDILSDRGTVPEEQYEATVKKVEEILEEDWFVVFGPWLDSVEDRL